MSTRPDRRAVCVSAELAYTAEQSRLGDGLVTILIGAIAVLVALAFAPFLLMMLFGLVLFLVDVLIIIPFRVIFFLLSFPFMLLSYLGASF